MSGSVFGFIWYYKASGFLNILWLLPWILSFLWWRFFFLLFFVTFVSDVCLSIYYTCFFLLCLLFVCWVRENFSGGPGHIFSVWDSAVWSAGPVQFIWVPSRGGWRDYTGFFFFSGSVVAGTVRLKWWRGDMSFPSFSSLFCHFFWWLDVCGKILCCINRGVSLVESWFFRDFVFYKVLSFLNLLQVVQAE